MGFFQPVWSARVALPLAAMAACTEAPAPEPAPPASVAVASSWTAEVAQHPDRFGALLEAGGREGWVALHSGDAKAAYAAFSGENPAAAQGRSRAASELAALYAAVVALDADIRARRAAQAQARGASATPAQTADQAAFDACQAGRFEDAAGWVGERLPLYAGAPEPLAQAASTVLRTEAEESFNRQFYDPCALPALARAWRTTADSQAALAQEAPALGWTLLSGWPTPADRDAALQGAPPHAWPSAAALRQAPLTDTTAVQPAREQIHALDAALDADRNALLAVAPDDGRSLLNDLGLIPRMRQGWLVARAEAALAAGQRAPALVLAEGAVDVTERGVGPLNSPAAWVTLARAHLASGHSREALDALHVLAGPYPEFIGARERLADLVVAEGLGRNGDSKEH